MLSARHAKHSDARRLQLSAATLFAVGALATALAGCSPGAGPNSASPTARASSPPPSASQSSPASASPAVAAPAGPSSAPEPSPSILAAPTAAVPSPPASADVPSPSVPASPASTAAPAPTAPPAADRPAPPSAVQSPASPTPAPPTVSQPAAVTITDADEGKTFHVKPGASVLVMLTVGNGMQPWNIVPPDPRILAPANNPPATSGQTAQGYRAVSAGVADISATDRPACKPGEVCAHFIRAFKATVIVDPG